MPAFKLKKSEIEKIYQYISHSPAIFKERALSPAKVRFLMPDEIFDSVMKPIFSKKCRHCHTSSVRNQKKIQGVFPGMEIEFFLEKRGGSFEPTLESLAYILPPKMNCSESQLLRRLKNRRKELLGQYDVSLVGMPMTQGPVSDFEIDQIQIWQSSGCPKDGQFLCPQCR